MGVLKVKYGQRFEESWKEFVEPYLLPHAIAILTVRLGVLLLLTRGPVAALVVVAGSLVSQVLVYRSREQAKENRELRARVGSLEQALTTSNTTFGTMVIRDLGARDGYTDRHAAATATYAADLASEMKLDEARVGRLRMAGLLHNIGLFGLPEDLLLATGKLNSIAQSRLADTRRAVRRRSLRSPSSKRWPPGSGGTTSVPTAGDTQTNCAVPGYRWKPGYSPWRRPTPPWCSTSPAARV